MSDFATYYYYQVHNATLGPYNFGELLTRIEAGDVKSYTQVWREGINQWYPLCSYREFHLSGESELGLHAQSRRNPIGRSPVMETASLNKKKNPYYVLGVPSFATTGQIRSAYRKRVKVLRPYRFDRTTQPVEWQVVHDVLQELKEAYDQVTPSNQNENQRFETDRGANATAILSRAEYINELTERNA